MGIVVVNFRDTNKEENSHINESKNGNSNLDNEKKGFMQQYGNGKGGDLNNYHREFPKIYSNFDKRIPPALT